MACKRAFGLCMLLSFALLAVGCTSTQHIQVDMRGEAPSDTTLQDQADGQTNGMPANGQSVRDVQDDLADRTARISLQDGRFVESARGLRLTSDSLSFIAGEDQQRRAVSVRDVETVTVTRRGRGTLEGLGLGLVGGIVVEAIGGRIAASEGDFFGSEAQTVFGGLTGGVVGFPLAASSDSFVDIGGCISFVPESRAALRTRGRCGTQWL